MAWTLPVLIASSVAAVISLPLWLLHRQRRRLESVADNRAQRPDPTADNFRRELEGLREGLSDGLLEAEGESLVVVSLNQALLDLLGQTRAGLAGASLETIIAPEVRSGLSESLRGLPENQSFFRTALPCLGGDGARVLIDLGARRVRIAGRDRLLLLLRPAGPRLAAQQACCQDQALYRSLVEAAADGYFLADLDRGRFLFLNPSLRAGLGLPAEGGPALGIWDLLAPEEHPRARQRQAEMERRGPAPLPPEVYAAHLPDGGRLQVEVTVSLATYQDRPVLQGLVRDVSERESLRAQLQQAQKLQAVGALAGGVAHEFNNLLMALGGYLQLLREKLGGQAEALVYVDKMDRACQRANGLTRQVLSLSRRKAGRCQVVEVNQVVREVHDLLRQTLPSAISLGCELAPDLPPVLADPGQIQQVLLNLGLNARDALPEGGQIRFITAEASGPARPGQPPQVVLEVADDGVGMSAEVRERIFEPFFTTKEAGHGTGLGLAVVHSLVRGLGGEISVTSQPGQGSVFRISLPASGQARPAKTPAEADQACRPQGCDLPGGLVLLVGDDPTLREVLAELLASQGHRVLEAGDGQAALAILAELREQGRAPDLLLLDMALPRLDGAGLLRRLAADQAAFPILVLSAQGQTPPPEAAGLVREVLEKPLDMPYLLARVSLALCLESPAQTAHAAE